MGEVRRPTYTDPKTGEQKASRIWWIRYYRDGRRYEESSHSKTKSVAIDLLRSKEGKIADGIPINPKMGRIRFEEAAADLLNDYATNDYDTRADAERRIELHLKPYFGGWRMISISSADIRAYITKRKAATESITRAYDLKRPDWTVRRVPEQRRKIAGASNGEINRELAVLKRMFTLAVQGGKLYAMPHIEMLQERNVRAGFFEREQFEGVCAHLPAHLRNVATMAYITGWRTKSEILPLEWRHVDFQAGEVRLDAGMAKNEEGRTFPLTVALRDLLEEQRALADERKQGGTLTPWVFAKKNGARIGSFRKAWQSACAAAGCPGRIVHDFRRTAVRNLVRASIPEAVAMKMTGHKTRSVFERYNIVSPADLTEAGRKLDASMGHLTPENQQGKKRVSEGFPENPRSIARTDNPRKINSLPIRARSSAG